MWKSRCRPPSTTVDATAARLTTDMLDRDARDVATFSRAGESGDRRVFSRSDRRSRLRGWIPMAIEGTSALGRIAQEL
jgi:hypothetical protein